MTTDDLGPMKPKIRQGVAAVSTPATIAHIPVPAAAAFENSFRRSSTAAMNAPLCDFQSLSKSFPNPAIIQGLC